MRATRLVAARIIAAITPSATNAIMNGVDVVTLAKILGRAHISMTEK